MELFTENEEAFDATVTVVAAYVGGGNVQPAQVPDLIKTTYAAFAAISGQGWQPGSVALEPAVPVKKSVTPDFIICLEDGKKFKSLKRHLRTHYDMTPEQYRAKWGLPADYPMVAPNYASARSELAKKMGLGTARKAA